MLTEDVSGHVATFREELGEVRRNVPVVSFKLVARVSVNLFV